MTTKTTLALLSRSQRRRKRAKVPSQEAKPTGWLKEDQPEGFALRATGSLASPTSVGLAKEPVADLSKIASWLCQKFSGSKMARRKEKGKKERKEIANRLCQALMYAEVVESQRQFSTDWLGKSKSYLGTIKAINGRDISRGVAKKLVAALGRWVSEQDEMAVNPRLAHAISEGRTALTALRERLN